MIYKQNRVTETLLLTIQSSLLANPFPSTKQCDHTETILVIVYTQHALVFRHLAFTPNSFCIPPHFGIVKGKQFLFSSIYSLHISTVNGFG